MTTSANSTVSADSTGSGDSTENGGPIVNTQAPLPELASVLSPDALVTDRDVIDSYSSDKALFCPAGAALALVRAANIDDVAAVMRFAAEHRVPVVCRAVCG